MSRNFDVSRLLSAQSFPHEYSFSDPAFRGLTIKHRELPDDWDAIVSDTIGSELEALGFDKDAAILHLLGGVTLTGEEYTAFQDAMDELSAVGKKKLAALLLKGQHSIAIAIVGSWNDPADIKEALPLLLTKYPSLSREIFTIAQTKTLTPAKRDFLST